jgi:hypothetical protein
MEKTRSDPRLSWKELTSFVCAILLTCLDKSICIQHPVRSLNSHAFSTPHMTIHTHTHAHTHTHTSKSNQRICCHLYRAPAQVQFNARMRRA